jgi:alpha/beta superfamily hydrolase
MRRARPVLSYRGDSKDGRGISCSLDLVRDADHFYMGREKALAAAIQGFFMRNNVSKKMNIE